jgi:tetratricopeptide (TPR) repeat protein
VLDWYAARRLAEPGVRFIAALWRYWHVRSQTEERHEDAARLLRECLALRRELDDEEGIAWSLDHLGLQALDVHEYDRAYRLSEEALRLFQRQNHAWGTAVLYFHVGVAALARNDLAAAEQRFEQAMVVFRDLANNWGLVSCMIHLGFAALAQDDHAAATGHLTRALAQARADANVVGMANALCGLASLAVVGADCERAAYLLGAVEAVIRPNRARTTVYERTRYAAVVAAVTAAARTDAGAAVSRALATGRGTPITTVVAEILDEK